LSASVNPLSRIDVESPECVSDSASLADSLVIRGGGEETHWDDTAASFLQGILLYVAALPESEPSDYKGRWEARRHLGTLRQILTQPESSLAALLKELSQDEETAHGMIARCANMFLGKADRERSGVLSTAQRHTAFLDDPRVVETLKSSDLDFQTLKTEVQTVFLVMPPDKLKAYSRYSRLVLGMALKAMTKTQGLPEHPVVFMLDEFAQLGHFAPAEEALSILRGYGGCLWVMVQDLSQHHCKPPKLPPENGGRKKHGGGRTHRGGCHKHRGFRRSIPAGAPSWQTRSCRPSEHRISIRRSIFPTPWACRRSSSGPSPPANPAPAPHEPRDKADYCCH